MIVNQPYRAVLAGICAHLNNYNHLRSIELR